jgi:alanyl-tRNA synthetase
MTTERLYYTASYQTEFDATLTGLAIVNDHPAVLLERTCFYPTSGGQPFDTGDLGGQAVVDVVANEAGEVWHLLAAPWPGAAIGDRVHGKVAWTRRYDHMQQHSGQHLLSQIFFQRFGFETVSVHFGPSESTLDLDVATLEPGHLEEAERQANELVYALLPIKSYFVTAAELPQVPLRRPPKVTGNIRIVEIDGFDYSACGGTHVRTTAEIGPIKLTRLERRRGQTRISFLCGKRALNDYLTKHRLLSEAAALFSTEIAEVPGLIVRNQAQLKELQRSLQEATEQLVRYEAVELAEQAGEEDQLRVVRRLFVDRTADAVKTLALQLQKQPKLIALLGAVAAGKLSLIFARSSDLDQHMGDLLRDTLQQAGGKGGGRPDFAQGGLADVASGAALLETAESAVRRSIGDCGD